MIDWVHVLCLQWGREVRKHFIEELGYSGRSSMMMLIDGVYLADHSAYTQHFAEVFTRSAREVSQAIHAHVPYEEGRVLAAHYVVNWCDATEKAFTFHMDRSTYYRRLRTAKRELRAVL